MKRSADESDANREMSPCKTKDNLPPGRKIWKTPLKLDFAGFIPEFDPYRKECTITTWLRKIEQLGDNCGWDDKIKLLYLQSKLHGQARQWYNRIEEYDFSWSQSKQMLVLAFPKHREYAGILEEMFNRKKLHYESMTKYYQDKVEMCFRCKLPNNATISCIIGGLPFALQSNARAYQCKRPNQLYEGFLRTFDDYRPHTSDQRDKDIVRLSEKKSRPVNPDIVPCPRYKETRYLTGNFKTSNCSEERVEPWPEIADAICNLSELIDDMNKLTLDSQLLTDDDSSNLDKAMMMVQNLTLSCDVGASNTRRSLAISGVSSNLSGRMVLAGVHKEYKYKNDYNTRIAEQIHLRVTQGPIQNTTRTLHLKKKQVLKSNPVVIEHKISRKNVHEEYKYEDYKDTLKAELVRLGVTPRPIQNTTRKKKQVLKSLPVVIEHKKSRKTYSVELTKSLENGEWLKNLSPYKKLQSKIQTDFEHPNRIWRGGKAKTSFTYLLLDPRITKNLPAKASHQTHQVSWATFISSIFYIGKGQRSRPYSHLHQALTPWKSNIRKSGKQKIQHILDIWSDNLGVICLHVFQNVIPVEAYTYEASMIDVIGLQNLKNEKVGNYYGVAEQMTRKERHMLALFLLYKALNIYIHEGERQLRPDNIKAD